MVIHLHVLVGLLLSCSVLNHAAAGTFRVISDIPTALGQTTLNVGANGLIYGTGRSPTNGKSFIFKLTPAGEYSELFVFNGKNGESLSGGLVDGQDGYLYGVTTYGGDGNGTVFRVNDEGVVWVLVRFNGANGSHPYGQLCKGGDGYFYGTTRDGGSSNQGTVFRITADGLLTTLTSCAPATGGYCLEQGLVKGSHGTFYGVGGGNNVSGQVFRITVDGSMSAIATIPTVPTIDPPVPGGSACMAQDGILYDVLSQGVNPAIIKTSTSGGLSIICRFQPPPPRPLSMPPEVTPCMPQGKLLLARDGNIYGCSLNHYDLFGRQSSGTIFRIAPDGTLPIVHILSSPPAWAMNGLVEGKDSELYGVMAKVGSGKMSVFGYRP